MEKIEIECGNNDSSESRSGVVTLENDDGHTATLSVTQNGTRDLDPVGPGGTGDDDYDNPVRNPDY